MAQHRNPKTGRFVSTANTPESREGKFTTYAEMPVEIQGADPGDLAYRSEERYAPSSDDLAQGGQGSPLRARNPELVHPDDEGFHNAVMRSAIRRMGPEMDNPMPYLAGLESHGTPANGVRQVSDVPDDPADVRGALRPSSRGLGRGRDR
jgi:hypothetical protein